jgi:hypothetical protein
VEIHCGKATRQLPEVVIQLCFVAFLLMEMLPQAVISRFVAKSGGKNKLITNKIKVKT